MRNREPLVSQTKKTPQGAFLAFGAQERTFNLQSLYRFRIFSRYNRSKIYSTFSSPLMQVNYFTCAGTLRFARCPGEDLNLHTFRHIHLKDACIPISPPGHIYSHLKSSIPQNKKGAITQPLVLCFLLRPQVRETLLPALLVLQPREFLLVAILQACRWLKCLPVLTSS